MRQRLGHKLNKSVFKLFVLKHLRIKSMCSICLCVKKGNRAFIYFVFLGYYLISKKVFFDEK